MAVKARVTFNRHFSFDNCHLHVARKVFICRLIMQPEALDVTQKCSQKKCNIRKFRNAFISFIIMSGEHRIREIATGLRADKVTERRRAAETLKTTLQGDGIVKNLNTPTWEYIFSEVHDYVFKVSRTFNRYFSCFIQSCLP